MDIKLQSQRVSIPLGERTIDAIHIPGHSPGSVTYLFESEGQVILFAQDAHGPVHLDLRSNAADYQNSLRRLLDLQSDILCEGHYGIFIGKTIVADFIERFVA